MSEGKINFDALKQFFSDQIIEGDEAYNFTWVGKKESMINAHTPINKTLRPCVNESVNWNSTENLYIEGDNLEVLKLLQESYLNSIKMIYIDPPYNTGNDFIYRDNFAKTSEEYDEEIGVFNEENEKLFKNTDSNGRFHSDWCSMIYSRLLLARNLLADDGVIFISIDDNEQENLKKIADEIFGKQNFVAQLVWEKKKKGSFLSKTLRKMIEYVLCYKKTDSDIEFYGESAYSDKWQPIVKRTNQEKNLKIPAKIISTTLVSGKYEKGFRGKEGTGINFLNDFVVDNGVITTEISVNGRFVWTQDFLDKELRNGTQISLSNKYGFNVLRFDQSAKTKTPSTLINEANGVGTNEDASLDLQHIFKSGVNEVFQYSKPHSLVEYLINMLCKDSPDSIILDSFAGSGTTAHAVLNLNKADGGNRKFILVEMEDYAETITAERVRRVINGYGNTEGTGGGFDYYELGEPIFNEDGYLNENIGTEKLREYIWYSETRAAMPVETCHGASLQQQPSNYLLGNHNGTAYYFYYEKDRITTLSHETLNIVVERAETYVVYADQCVIDKEWLAANHIIFKKIPRDVRKF